MSRHGIQGKKGVFELLTIDDDFREAFLKRRDLRELQAMATADGMRTLREDGIVKIRAGVTTPEEILRVT